MFLVLSVPPGLNFEELTSIRFLFRLAVKWQRFDNRDGLQCKNCQRFGHTANNCSMEYRCVNCVDKHRPGQCCKVAEDRAACVNFDAADQTMERAIGVARGSASIRNERGEN